MSLSPSLLFSSAARYRCLAKIKSKIYPYTDNTVIDPTDKIVSSVLVPLCVENDQVCLLYTLRSTKLAKYGGQVSFPGGKQDIGETAIETAVRETEEEIGFPRDSIDVWGTMNSLPSTRDSKLIINPVVGLLCNFDMKVLVRSEHEVDEIYTLTMEALCDTTNHAHYMWKSICLPIFKCGKHKIWGITGMITHVFLSSFLSSNVYKPDFMKKCYTYEELKPKLR